MILVVWSNRLSLSSHRLQDSDSRIEEAGSLEEKRLFLLVVVFLGSTPVITFKYTEAISSKLVPVGAWWTKAHGVARVRHHLATKPPPRR